MSILGDYSDSNYSSARFASIIDNAMWEKYQELILRVTEEAYELWPGRPFYESEFEGWSYPVFPQIDPTKTATTNKIMVDNKFKSPQQVIREDGGDPEETFREIEEFMARFPAGTGAQSGRNPETPQTPPSADVPPQVGPSI